MWPRWTHLNEQDWAAFGAAIAFLDGRLEERATVDWALQLKPNETSKRLALLKLINRRAGRNISEPWRSAWRLIEESWNNPVVEDNTSLGADDAQDRLDSGDRSGSLVNAIIELVAPLLKVEPFSGLYLHSRQPPTRVRRVEDLFSTGLTNREIIDPGVLGLGGLTDRSFLMSLALALDAAVGNGLDIARRLGWSVEGHWQLGGLYRVYYVPVAERVDGEDEPDQFHRGIAPSVKLLHAVVARLVDVDASVAVGFVCRWKLINSPIHLRLWAALSRDPRVTSASEVGALLLSLDDQRFWNLHNYPEIAELRAKRFAEFDAREQAALTARVRRRPPRNQWPREDDADRIENARLYWAVRELRRIEIAGATLQRRDKVWLDTRINEFIDLAHMSRLDEGFTGSSQVHRVLPNPDARYDSLAGEERLKALEAALSSARRSWDDDPARCAEGWIRQPGNPARILVDLESIPDGGSAFARVWERFGWAHSPAAIQGEDAAQRDLSAESAHVLSLLDKLPIATIRQAIQGISHWLFSWEEKIVAQPEALMVWLRLWPIAVEATNALKFVQEEGLSNTGTQGIQSSDDRNPMDHHTLNTPAGKLVGVFLAACPRPGDRPFNAGRSQRSMRNAIESVLGPAASIVKYRLITEMPYFLAADELWTRENLVRPLLVDSPEARTLWGAVARQKFSFKVMKILGNELTERAIDPQLNHETRRSLVFKVIVECLYAFKDLREPAVPHTRIQQMIRRLDEEVRAFGADVVQRFLRDVSAQDEQDSPSPKQLFQSAVAPFLQKVWPQERSLTTPGVSRALARLPATAQEAFAEAVDAIERFLVPFECWSMIDYGLYGKKGGQPKLSKIDNHAKAAAFLRLLNLTIGTAEGSVIPHDLPDALDQIRRAAPKLVKDPLFRRLETAARRG